MTSTDAYGLSVEEITLLARESADAKGRAYCPYSKFRVGCALLLKSPTSTSSSSALPSSGIRNSDSPVITGANIENAAYPVGTCAERVALGTAIASGLQAGDFKAIAVATDTIDACSPCGMCRQFIREFCALDTPIVMFPGNEGGKVVVKTLGELLPMSFGPEKLLDMDTARLDATVME